MSKRQLTKFSSIILGNNNSLSFFFSLSLTVSTILEEVGQKGGEGREATGNRHCEAGGYLVAQAVMPYSTILP